MDKYNRYTISKIIKIQQFFRNIINKNIYNKLKSNIKNPEYLLKILKKEYLKDYKALVSNSNLYIRFKLAGDIFPPFIYFKIYNKGAVCDVNSFAPRNYATISKPYCKVNISEYNKQYKISVKDKWYKKKDNNGWQLVL